MSNAPQTPEPGNHQPLSTDGWFDAGPKNAQLIYILYFLSVIVGLTSIVGVIMQFDADTVGAPGVQADAEMAMMMADTMEALGIARGDYVIRVNNRKVLDGVMEAIGLDSHNDAHRRLTVLRALDKRDKFLWREVKKLLGKGRRDKSGDYTPGAGLRETQIHDLKRFLDHTQKVAKSYFPDAARFYQTDHNKAEMQLNQIRQGFSFIGDNSTLRQGVEELICLHRICSDAWRP